jgi:hypothetical protein
MNPKLWAITVSMFLLFSNIALAIPGIPHQFYGAVTVNGVSAPDGTTVSARINGIEVASTTTSGGKYGYDGFFVDDPNSVRTGSAIKFFVNGVDTGVTVTFCNGCFNECGIETQGCAPLDFSVTIESSSGTTTNGGTGSIGGSASVIDTTDSTTTSTSGTTQEEGVCQEKWTCSEWGECINGIQTRVCADENQCGTNSREPFSSQPCTAAMSAAVETTPGSPIGFFLLASNEMLIATIVGIAAIIVIFLFLRMRKQKSSIVHVAKMDDIKQALDSSDQTDPSKSSGIEP